MPSPLSRPFALIALTLTAASCASEPGASGGGSGGTTICGTSVAGPANCVNIDYAISEGLSEAQQCSTAADCEVIKDPICASGGYPLSISTDAAARQKHTCALAERAKLGCNDTACDWWGGATTAICNASGRCAFTSTAADAGRSHDGGSFDGGSLDAGAIDTGTTDSGTTDSGTTDSGTTDGASAGG